MNIIYQKIEIFTAQIEEIYGKIRGFATQIASLNSYAALKNSANTFTDVQIISAPLTGNLGASAGLSINPIINQSGTAGYSALKVNVTESAAGSGSKYLADLQFNGASQLRVDTAGSIFFANGNYLSTSGILISGFVGTNSYVSANGIQNNGNNAMTIGTVNAQVLNFRTNNTVQGTFSTAGNLLLGTTADVSSSKLTVSSTTQGAIPAPKMTTAQRDAISNPSEGLQVYNLTTHTMDFYNGSVWKSVATL